MSRMSPIMTTMAIMAIIFVQFENNLFYSVMQLAFLLPYIRLEDKVKYI